MLKESIRDLVLAIAEGDTLTIEDSFNSVMASKISDRLDSMRVDVAQGMFGSVVEETVDESTNWAAHNAKTSARKEASPEELHAEFKKYANNPGHHYYKGKFSDDKDGGKTAEQKAITNIALGIGKADKQNYAARISHLIKPKATNEELTLEDYSVEELEDFMMSEDFEQLDEISKKTLGSYVTKAHDQLMKHTASVNFKSGRGDSDVLSYTHEPRTARKTANRTKGVATAIGKLTKEEVEELDEISKATLGSYVKKASVDAAVHTDKFGRGGTGVTYSNTAGVADKRLKGVSKAVDKLTKESFDIEDYSFEELEDFMMSEEFEQLDELSKSSIKSYLHKAGKQYSNSIDKMSTARTAKSQEKHAAIQAKRHKGIGSALKRQTADSQNTHGVKKTFLPNTINSPEKITKNTLSSRSISDIAKDRKNVKD